MLLKKKEVIHNPLWNQPVGTDETVRLWEILIPPDFAKTTPLSYKMKMCKERYKKLGHLDEPITVIAETNERGKPNKLLLVDGYSRYLYAKYNIKLKYVPVRYIDIDKVDTYLLSRK